MSDIADTMTAEGNAGSRVDPRVPQHSRDRQAVRLLARRYAAAAGLTPPLSPEELSLHSRAMCAQGGVESGYADFAAVTLNNEVWSPVFAAVPFNRRLLLLPKCLRDEENCKGSFDALGLACGGCGRCEIQNLLDEARRLGYVVLVAEGTPVVMSLVESGRVEAVAGVSCMESLAGIFPHVEAAAIPSAAIPLLSDGCRRTTADLEWIRETIRIGRDNSDKIPDWRLLRGKVRALFEPEALTEILGPVDGDTARLSREWIAVAGKRWRPVLLACSHAALAGDGENIPRRVRQAAAAVECFHKASLAHDDIEDNDRTRYGGQTLHERYGVPVALNVGDFLIGEGYRLLAECDAPAEERAAMLAAASRAHHRLCAGQGEELLWAKNPGPISVERVLGIFAGKTAPAFEAALRIGAICAGGERAIAAMAGDYCLALGIGYQIRDDMDDLASDSSDLAAGRPSLPLAIAYERSSGRQREFLEGIWRSPETAAGKAAEIRAVVSDLRVEQAARQLLERYRLQAAAALSSLRRPALKIFLRRLIGRILDNPLESPREFANKNDSGRQTGL